MKIGLFYFPAIGSGDPQAYERRNIGNDPAQYEYLLEDIKLQAQLAEEHGFHGVYFAEHHFDTEGFELCHNPLLFDAWVAKHTQRIKVGQLGLVLPSWSPLRLAEDIAVLSYIFPGRFELGFARGFQTREVTPLAAAHQVEGALSDMSEADKRNRRLFLEHYEILMKALREKLFHYEGEFNTVPPKGLSWTNPATRNFGGGVDANGVLTEIGTVPPLEGALPQRWQAFSFSPETMEWAAREGMNLAMFEVKPDFQRKYQEVFLEEANKHGRNLRYGQGISYTRGVLCLEDRERARTFDKAACDKVWGEWFSGTGFTNAFALPSDELPLPYSYEMLADRGFNYVGTPDDVTRCLEKLVKDTNLEYLNLHIQTGAVPREVLLESIDLFARKVLPRFDFEPLEA